MSSCRFRETTHQSACLTRVISLTQDRFTGRRRCNARHRFRWHRQRPIAVSWPAIPHSRIRMGSVDRRSGFPMSGNSLLEPFPHPVSVRSEVRCYTSYRTLRSYKRAYLRNMLHLLPWSTDDEERSTAQISPHACRDISRVTPAASARRQKFLGTLATCFGTIRAATDRHPGVTKVTRSTSTPRAVELAQEGRT